MEPNPKFPHKAEEWTQNAGFFFFFCDARDWTQGHVLVRQALYQLSYIPSPHFYFFILRQSLTMTGLEIAIILPQPLQKLELQTYTTVPTFY